MFEIGRELKRFFSPPQRRDGLCPGDPSLLELLDMRLLQNEGRSADVAAGRIGTRDRAVKLVEASRVWREYARRTGDAAALRKAASSAEQASELSRKAARSDCLRRAICEQAEVALLGADLFGEDGLNAAAEFLVGQASDAAMTRPLTACLAARRALPKGDAEQVQAAVQGFERALVGLNPRRREDSYTAARLRCDRAEFLVACGARLREPQLMRSALLDLDKAQAALDGAYHPLTLSRVQEVRAAALVRMGELEGDVGPILEGVDVLALAIELLTPDHSPMDWARLHHSRGVALMALGESGASEPAFDRALQAFVTALNVLNAASSVALRTVAAQDRAGCLVRRAEIKGDAMALDEAEAILRSELASLRSPPEPVVWAVLQLNLARIYMAQTAARGRDRGEGARAGEALSAALDVFAERGLRSLASAAQTGLEALREGSKAH